MTKQPNNSYLSPAIPCRLEGYTYGRLNAWAYPGDCFTDNWTIESVCETASIQVRAGLARDRVEGTDGLPVFYYD